MDDYSRRIEGYRLAMNIARTMLKRGIITEKDYETVSRLMAEKYGISLFSIFLT